jgi:hypothetical protein
MPPLSMREALCESRSWHIENDYRVLFTRTTDLVQRLQQARQALSLESAIEQLHGGTEPAHERPEPSGVSRMALFAGCWLQDAIRKRIRRPPLPRFPAPPRAYLSKKFQHRP